jgi:hypothetical protein
MTGALTPYTSVFRKLVFLHFRNRFHEFSFFLPFSFYILKSSVWHTFHALTVHHSQQNYLLVTFDQNSKLTPPGVRWPLALALPVWRGNTQRTASTDLEGGARK